MRPSSVFHAGVGDQHPPPPLYDFGALKDQIIAFCQGSIGIKNHAPLLIDSMGFSRQGRLSHLQIG